jgi:hypothetical protein
MAWLCARGHDARLERTFYHHNLARRRVLTLATRHHGLGICPYSYATGFGFGDRCATEQSKERDASVLEMQVLQIVRGVIPLSMATVHS